MRAVALAAVVALACSPTHDGDVADAPHAVDTRLIDAPPIDGPSPAIYGCADATREGFSPPTMYPDIAACAGGWDGSGGLVAARTGCPVSGNDSLVNRDGSGCAAADLCAVGWAICADQAAVAAAIGSTRCDDGIDVAGFYATNQATSAVATCSGSGALDMIGCSTDGIGGGVGSSCAPLEKSAGSACDKIAGEGWSCGSAADAELRLDVMKAFGPGGVLCCRIAP